MKRIVLSRFVLLSAFVLCIILPDYLSSQIQNIVYKNGNGIDAISGHIRIWYNIQDSLNISSSESAERIATKFLQRHVGILGITVNQTATIRLVSAHNGPYSTQVRFEQQIYNIPILNSMLLVTINRNGKVIAVKNTFSTIINTNRTIAGISEMGVRKKITRYQKGVYFRFIKEPKLFYRKEQEYLRLVYQCVVKIFGSSLYQVGKLKESFPAIR